MRTLIRNAAVALLVFGSLLWAFVTGRPRYPLCRWDMYSPAMLAHPPSRFYLLRGETLDGRQVDVSAAGLTGALGPVNATLVAAVLKNRSLLLPSPHPLNATLLKAAGGPERLPEGVLMQDLLGAWGAIYNGSLPEGSPDRLRILRLEAHAALDPFTPVVESWEKSL